MLDIIGRGSRVYDGLGFSGIGGIFLKDLGLV